MENKYLHFVENIITNTKNTKFKWSICQDKNKVDLVNKFTSTNKSFNIYQTSIVTKKKNDVFPEKYIITSYEFYIVKQSLNNPFDCIKNSKSREYPFILIGFKTNSPLPLVITIDLLGFSSILQELYEVVNKSVTIENQIDSFIEILDNPIENNIEFIEKKESTSEYENINSDELIIDKKSTSEYLNPNKIYTKGKEGE